MSHKKSKIINYFYLNSSLKIILFLTPYCWNQNTTAMALSLEKNKEIAAEAGRQCAAATIANIALHAKSTTTTTSLPAVQQLTESSSSESIHDAIEAKKALFQTEAIAAAAESPIHAVVLQECKQRYADSTCDEQGIYEFAYNDPQYKALASHDKKYIRYLPKALDALNEKFLIRYAVTQALAKQFHLPENAPDYIQEILYEILGENGTNLSGGLPALEKALAITIENKKSTLNYQKIVDAFYHQDGTLLALEKISTQVDVKTSNLSAVLEGFAKGTLVKTPYGYYPIELLAEGDIVSGFDHKQRYSPKKITKIAQGLSEKCVTITMGDKTIYTTSNQKFYLPRQKEWVEAKDLTPGAVLLKNRTQEFEIDAIITSDQSIELYYITVEDHHFFITEEDACVHNHGGTFVLSKTAEHTIAILPPPFKAAAIGGIAAWQVGTIFWRWLKGNKQNDNVTTQPEINNSSPIAPNQTLPWVNDIGDSTPKMMHKTVELANSPVPYQIICVKKGTDDALQYSEEDHKYPDFIAVVTINNIHCELKLRKDYSYTIIEFVEPKKDTLPAPETKPNATSLNPPSSESASKDKLFLANEPTPNKETAKPLPTEKQKNGSELDGPQKNNNDEKQKKLPPVPFYEKNLKHMFCDDEGHIPDNPANRQLITDVASSKNNYLGTCANGNSWYGQVLDNGKQVWACVRDGCIRNCGLNNDPIEFNPTGGLCRPFRRV